MLTDLSIRNFALVDRLDLEFAPGLLCITGETGAGKSILVNALSFVLGERAQSEFIRTGAESCEVTAVFSVEATAEWRAAAHELGLAVGREVVLRRDFATNGRSRVWIDDRPATVQALKHLGGMLCDLHGQHQHQWLLDPERHREFLDAFLTGELLPAYREAFETARERQAGLTAARKQLAEYEKQRDFWAFQLRELDAVDPQAGEYDELTARRDRIRHAAELNELYQLTDAELAGADDSLSPRLSHLAARLRRAASHDAELAEWADAIESARTTLDDIAVQVSRRLTELDADPGELDRLEARLHQLYKLKTKYGGSVDAAVEARVQLREKLDSLENSAVVLGDLETAAAHAEAELAARADRLHAARTEAATRMRAALHDVLSELGLGADPLYVECRKLERSGWHESGPDHVEFSFAANPKEEPKPLARVASGGELSRVMLALKSVLPGNDRVGTLIFDEVDSGVGGIAATRVAERLQALARGRQVVVITHLHPIAARADVHWVVEKATAEGRHVPVVRMLNAAQRVEELGRLIAGGEATKESRAAARSLVKPRGRR